VIKTLIALVLFAATASAQIPPIVTTPGSGTNAPNAAADTINPMVTVVNELTPLVPIASIPVGTIVGAPAVSISTVAITGTAGQISFTASGTVVVGQQVTIAGTYGGTGSITGYTNPTTYVIGATNGSSTATLTAVGGAPLVTTAGTPSGLTYSFAAAPGALSAAQGGILDNAFYQQLLGNGCTFTSGHDDGPCWNTTLATCTLAARCQIYLPPGLTSYINTGITITSGVESFNGNGLTFNASGMTTGCISLGTGCYAITVQPASGTVGGYYSVEFAAQLPMENFRLLGPASTASTVDGIGIVGGANAIANQVFRNYVIRGFRDGMAFGSQAYIISSYYGYIAGNWRSGVTAYGTTTGGEDIAFHGGNVSGNNSATAITFTGSISANATSATLNTNWTLPTGIFLTCFSDGEIIPVTYTNGATTATFATAISNNVTASASTVAAGIWLQNTEIGSKEVELHSVSVDYNDVNIVNLGGDLSAFGSHSEDNHYQFPMMAIVQNSGSQATCVKWYGGSISPTETQPRSTALINLSAGFSKGCFVASTRFNIGSSGDLLFKTIVGTPFINIQGSVIDFYGTSATNYPDIGTALQLLVNPGFELDAGTGWTVNGSNYTLTYVTSPVQGGTYAAQMACASTGWAGSFFQTVNGLRPGQQVEYRAYVDITAYTSGTLNFNINFQSTGGTATQTNNIQSWTGTTSGYVPIQGYLTVPQSSTIVYPEFFGTAFIGTFVMDSFQIYVQ
jgi:hypothetical protein